MNDYANEVASADAEVDLATYWYDGSRESGDIVIIWGLWSLKPISESDNDNPKSESSP